MATFLGTLGPFEPDSEDWTCYCERLEQFVGVNGIDNADKKRAVLLSSCGSAVYQVIRNLVAPEKPADKSFSELVKLVRDHYCPPPSVTVQRYNFNSRTQKEGETVSQFVAELRRLSEHCDFKATLDDMLRDRIVCGVRNSSVQRRLLAESGLTFKKAFELVQSAESAEKNATEIQRSVTVAVNAVQKTSEVQARSRNTCYRCWGLKVSGAKGRGRGSTRGSAAVQQVNLPPVEGEETYTLFTLSREGFRAPLTIDVVADGVQLSMEVDTGAVASIISECTYRRQWSKQKRPLLQRTDVHLRTYTGEKINIKGKISLSVQINDLLASLTGGKVFSKLDLSHAYLQLPLDEKSKEYVTITTHRGLFRYNRMPFGVASAPAIFQRTMERILQGEGISPTKEKRRAIVDAPVPEDISQLKSFWGLVNYYAKFLPCLADTLAPLYKLLTKHQPWSWGADQAAAFQKAKFQLTSDVLLVHFDPSKKISLSCDASPYGIGVVLSHLQDDGSDRPIAYASRSLAPAEKNYSQIEKEGLAVVWGVKKFHQFLFGRQFVVYSDHKPLQFLFSETKPVPTMASSRIQRWALTLSAYNYQMVFRPGKNQGNADGLSRLPLAEAPEEVPVPGDTILMLQAFSDMSSVVTATSIRRWTDKDSVLSVVRRMVLHGWRTQSNEQFKPYECRKSELSVEDGCILWGSRVVVPPPGRVPIIKILHDGHPGVSRMKSLARSVVWWPGLDAELEAKQAIRVLRQVFSCHGLPEVLVSDNGTAFTSTEFQTFVQRNGFRHIRSAPYHPATNGLAERAVQTVKNALRKTSGDIDTCLSRFLFQYRGMPKWIPGKVTAVRGPLTLIVTLDDGTEGRYHVDHVKERITRDKLNYLQAPAPPIAEVEPDPDPLEEEAPPVADLEAVPLLPRRSTRPHRPPERYGL
eukprot:Em0001g99a